MPVHTELVTSTAVLILTISTIAVFIIYGYTILSYAVLAAALSLALFNAWLIGRGRAPNGSIGVRNAHRKKLKK